MKDLQLAALFDQQDRIEKELRQREHELLSGDILWSSLDLHRRALQLLIDSHAADILAKSLED